MTTTRAVSADSDYLEELKTRVSDLHGIGPLLFELLQNADDAVGATTFEIDIRDEKLVVANDATFTSCADPEGPWEHCQRTYDGPNRYCDFHAFRRRNSANKSGNEETTGKYGIGFNSVYQLTDRPTLRSSGQCWTYQPEDEHERISARDDDTAVAGTEFELPYARPNSPLRQALGINAPKADIAQGIHEAALAELPIGMLFLEQVSLVRIRYQGGSTEFRRSPGRGSITIECSNGSRREYVVARIEFKDGRDLDVAVRIDEEEKSRVFVKFPLQGSSKLPFHVNAPSLQLNSSRKHMDDSADNNTLLGRAIVFGLPRLLEVVCEASRSVEDALGIWRAVSRTLDGAWETHDDIRQQAVDKCIKAIHDTEKPVARDNGGEPTTIQDVYFADRLSDAARSALDEIDVPLAHHELCNALSRNRSRLKELGFDALRPADLYSNLSSYDRERSIDDTRGDRLDRSLLKGLWEFIASDWGGSAAYGRLGDRYIFPDTEGQLRSARELYLVDDAMLHAFAGVHGSDILDSRIFFETHAPHDLGGMLDEGEASAILTTAASVDVMPEGSAERILAWFEALPQGVASELRSGVRNLVIFPDETGDRHTLTSVHIKGDFSDPLGLMTFLDPGFVRENERTLRAIKADLRLSIGAYLEGLPRRIREHGSLSPEQARAFVVALARERDTLEDWSDRHREEVAKRFRSLEVIPTTNGVRAPSECVLGDPEIATLAGIDLASPQHGIDGVSDEDLNVVYDLLGVSTVVRRDTVLQAARKLAMHEVGAEGWAKLATEIFDWLVDNESGDDNIDFDLYADLRDLAWMPASRLPGHSEMRLERPSKLFGGRHRTLVGAVVASSAIHDESQRRSGAPAVLERLEMRSSPTPAEVVDNLVARASETPPRAATSASIDWLSSNVDSEGRHRGVLSRLSSVPWVPCVDDVARLPQAAFLDSAANQLAPLTGQAVSVLRVHDELASALGVRTRPDAHAIATLIRKVASSEVVASGDRDLVLQRLWSALSVEDPASLDQDEAAALGAVACLPGSDGRLRQPRNTLIRDRSNLALQLPPEFQEDLFEMPAWTNVPLLERLGSQRLSRACSMSSCVVRSETDATALDTNLRSKRAQVHRALNNVADIRSVESLIGVGLKLGRALSLTYSLKHRGAEAQFAIDDAQAVYDPDDGVVCAVMSGEGEVSLNALAREMVDLITEGRGASSEAASVLATVLRASSADIADRELDQLGFAPLDIDSLGILEEIPAVVPSPVVEEDGSSAEPISGASGIDDESDEDSVSVDATTEPNQPQQTVEDESSEQPSAESPASEQSPSSDLSHFATQLEKLGKSQPEPAPRSTAPEDHVQPAREPSRRKTAAPGPWNPVDRSSLKKSRPRPVRRRAEPKRNVQALSPETSRALSERRLLIDRIGVDAVLAYERKHGREPAEQAHNNPGFDVLSTDPDGRQRWIEIKSLSELLGQPGVRLSRTQFEFGMEKGEDYWLYIVHGVRSTSREIRRIQDPVGKIGGFFFGDDWFVEVDVVDTDQGLLDWVHEEYEAVRDTLEIVLAEDPPSPTIGHELNELENAELEVAWPGQRVALLPAEMGELAEILVDQLGWAAWVVSDGDDFKAIATEILEALAHTE